VPSRRQAAPLTSREREEILDRLRKDADTIAGAFGLRFLEILPARSDARSFYGLCDSEGRIRIRINHVKTGQALRYSSLVNTLCHELAHLKHFHHGPAFQTYYQRILGWARSHGLYRPGGHAEVDVVCRPPVSGAALRRQLERLRTAVRGSPDAHAAGCDPTPARPRQLTLFGDGG